MSDNEHTPSTLRNGTSETFHSDMLSVKQRTGLAAPNSAAVFFDSTAGASVEMEDAVADLLRAALIPELATDVVAGAAGAVHLRLVEVAALGAAPDELAAVAIRDLDLAPP